MVDLIATNISCTTLNVNGEVVSSVLQNIESSSPGFTSFDGTVGASNLESYGFVTCPSLEAGNATITNALDVGSVTSTGSVNGLVGTFGSITAVTTAGNITQSAGTTSLQATTVAGNLTMSGTSTALTQTGSTATASLKATTVTSLTDTGNLTMSGTSAVLSQTGTSATASLKATTVTSLTSSGNITQTAGTATLKAVAVDSLTISGSSLATPSYGTLSGTGSITTPTTTSWNNLCIIVPDWTGTNSGAIGSLVWSTVTSGGSTVVVSYNGVTSGNSGSAFLNWTSTRVPLINSGLDLARRYYSTVNISRHVSGTTYTYLIAINSSAYNLNYYMVGSGFVQTTGGESSLISVSCDVGSISLNSKLIYYMFS